MCILNWRAFMSENASLISRFSDSVAFDIPQEYRQKFRWLNIVQWIAIITFFIVGTSYSFPRFTGWETPYLDRIIISGVISIGIYLATIVLTIILLNMPKLGDVVFYRWLTKPENQTLVKEAIKEKKEEDRYSDKGKWYIRKLALISFMEKTGYKISFILGVLLNPVMLIAFFAIRPLPNFTGSIGSQILGILFVLTIIINIANIWIASAFYSRKDPENNKNRYVIEVFSWSYVLIQGFMFVFFMLGCMDILGLIGDDLREAGITAQGNFLVFYILYTVVCIIGTLLPIALLKFKPNYDWVSNDDSQATRINTKYQKFYNILRGLVIVVLSLLAIAFFILSNEILLTDFAMFFCVVSYYLAFTYFVFYFALIKLVKQKKSDYKRGKSPYVFLAKMTAIVIIINLLPSIMVNVYSNPNIESQFKAVYGNDWKTKIDPAYAARLPAVRYSAYDAYFGYETPVKAQYEIVYMQDSPRFVINKTSGQIVSNGSSKYTAIVHDMIFDAYLPATPEFESIGFGVGDPNVKLPVLMYLHGIGMDRGSGNANITSQYLANMGFLVVDMSYGFNGYCSVDYKEGRERGYDFPDIIMQLATFTKFLDNNSGYYHADLGTMFVAGRSYGGWIAASFGELANNDYAKGNYSSNVKIKGIIPYYPATDITGLGSDLFEVAGKLAVTDDGAPYIRGSSIETDPDYNPDWKYYDPLWVSRNTPKGMHPDVLVQGLMIILCPEVPLQDTKKR